ncbi:MAG: hypothetical protein A2Z20_07000 [Bdellovibrionales bacterium RBG_16_40_8]|nr:MAG: hypothetical protein A2Z20_07000 [Bdellovibrionales bacterium RBG_16_40_8]
MVSKIKILIFCIFFLIALAKVNAQNESQSDFPVNPQVQEIPVNEKSEDEPTKTVDKPASKPKPTPKPKRKPKDSGQDAKIIIDGAAIYEAPNFDAPVVEYMDSGKKVKISKKIYQSNSGLGSFYKIRIRKGVFGYVTDTDVKIAGLKGKDSKAYSGDDIDDDPTKIQPMFKDDEEQEQGHTLFFARYIGVNYSSFNYNEVINNRSRTATVSLFGIKLSGPIGLLGGAPMDMNVVFTTTAPPFYKDIATSTSGFMIIGDMLVLFPLYQSRSIIFEYGIGLVARYSSWGVSLINKPDKPPVDSQEIGVGVAGKVGAALKISDQVLFRADGKYYYENSKYFGFTAALQFKY